MIRKTLAIAALGLAAGAAAGQPTDLFDGFVDGETTLVSTGTPEGANYLAPSVPGARRTVTLFGSTGTTTLEVSVTPGEARWTTDGLGQSFIAYGYATLDGSGVANDYLNRLNADWSEYVGVRIPIITNDVRFSYRLDAATQRLSPEPSPYLGSSSTPLQTFVEGGFTGNLDVPFSAFTPSPEGGGGGVDWSDVDRFLISIGNGFVDSDLAIGPIQLIRATAPEDLDGDGVVGASDLALLIGGWGACPAEGPCPGDLDGDGMVGASDLARVIGAWG